MATVMSLSLLPLNVFAATTNRLSKAPSVVPKKTLFLESGVVPSSEAGRFRFPTGTGNDAIDYYVDGTDLILTVNDPVSVGDSIRLELENASWFFRSNGYYNDGNPGDPANPATQFLMTAPGGGGSLEPFARRVMDVITTSSQSVRPGQTAAVNTVAPGSITSIGTTMLMPSVSGNNSARIRSISENASYVSFRQALSRINSGTFSMANDFERSTMDFFGPSNSFNWVSTEKWGTRHRDGKLYERPIGSITSPSTRFNTTYELGKGLWGYDTRPNIDSANQTAGVYLRYGSDYPSTSALDSSRAEIPYSLSVSNVNDNRAVLTVLPIDWVGVEGENKYDPGYGWSTREISWGTATTWSSVEVGDIIPDDHPTLLFTGRNNGVYALSDDEPPYVDALSATERIIDNPDGSPVVGDETETYTVTAADGTITTTTVPLNLRVVLSGTGNSRFLVDPTGNIILENLGNGGYRVVRNGSDDTFLRQVGFASVEALRAAQLNDWNARERSGGSVDYSFLQDAETPQPRFRSYGDKTNEFWEIRIPLVSRSHDVDADIRVRITDSNLTSVSTGTYLYGVAGGNATNTWVNDPETARDDFYIDKLIIQETRLNSIRSAGSVSITAPAGFEFTNVRTNSGYISSDPPKGVRLGVEEGLRWGGRNSSGYGEEGVDYYIRYKNHGTHEEDRSVIYVTVRNLTRSTNISGSVYITGLRFTASENAPWGDVNFNIRNEKLPVAVANTNDVVGTPVYVPVGYRDFLDRTIELVGFGEDDQWYPIVTGGGRDFTYLRTGDANLIEVNWGADDENDSTIELSTRRLTINFMNGNEVVIPNRTDNWRNLGTRNRIDYYTSTATVSNVFTDTTGTATISDDLNVTNQSFKAGERADWTITLTTEGDIPDLINGRYSREASANAEDLVHKTAKVVFRENSVNAWWAGRQTDFVLSPGAKFRKVDITDASNIVEGDDLKGLYVSDRGQKQGSVTINGDTMTWNNLSIEWDDYLNHQPKKASAKFDTWISIESGTVGDVTLSVKGSAIPDQPGEVPPTVIARQVSPISITTAVTDQRIGYQYQPTSDIIITETKAGALERGKTVLVSVSDMVSVDVLFSPDAKIEVTSGNLRITDVGTVMNTSSVGWGNATLGLSGGTLGFKIDRPSSEPSTITISNVSVRIDRTVPESNDRPYNVIVWGEAIAPNYYFYNPAQTSTTTTTTTGTTTTTTTTTAGGNFLKLDKFATPGIMAEYVTIVSSANDRTSILTQEVRVMIGENYYTVNGVAIDMDAAAYISPASNSTMVPIRFVANAFGIRDDQVLWDDGNRTVTIILPNRVVQFTIDSSTMSINGVPVTMFSPDLLEVRAEITGERSYVPFRALGEAFGVEVAWDAATQTAIYNPGADRTTSGN